MPWRNHSSSITIATQIGLSVCTTLPSRRYSSITRLLVSQILAITTMSIRIIFTKMITLRLLSEKYRLLVHHLNLQCNLRKKRRVKSYRLSVRSAQKFQFIMATTFVPKSLLTRLKNFSLKTTTL